VKLKFLKLKDFQDSTRAPGDRKTILVVSDIHYASDAEKARGNVETQVIANPLVRFVVKAFRHYIWLRHPHAQNHLLDRFLAHPGPADYVIANGDYSCDSSFVGVMDDPTFASAQECLTKLRTTFSPRMTPTLGDHELGKMSLFGGRGGLRLASWHRAQEELDVQPFWQIEVGEYRLLGVTSSLVALPVYEPETLAKERAEWWQLRQRHMRDIQQAFASLNSKNKVILFCHDPTALPFLWREEAIRSKLPLVEKTVIGHLHSNLVFWKSRLLAGIPPVGFLGTSIRRMTSALNQAEAWRHFNLTLCPSLSGIELLQDGGYYSFQLDPRGQAPLHSAFHAVSRRPPEIFSSSATCGPCQLF